MFGLDDPCFAADIGGNLGGTCQCRRCAPPAATPAPILSPEGQAEYDRLVNAHARALEERRAYLELQERQHAEARRLDQLRAAEELAHTLPRVQRRYTHGWLWCSVDWTDPYMCAPEWIEYVPEVQ